MMHRAVRLIHYLREDLLRGASSWEMFTYQRAPGFGLLSQDAPQRRSMNYWLYYYFNRHAGRWVLALDGTAPYHDGSAGGRTYRGPLTPVVATLSQDEQQLYLILANGSWEKTVPVRVTLQGFAPRSGTGVVLCHSDPDGDPFLARREDLVRELSLAIQGQELTTVLQPHAVAFVTIQR
jgi:alpha-L-arabinofuranosidase